MKTIFTFLLTFVSLISFAQNAIVHTAEASNISVDATFIDHPDLNNNPDAKLLITHVWNPGGSGGVYNDNTTGAFYSSGNQRWAVYNEDGTAMVEGSSYNIYYTEGDEVYVHVADAANQGSVPEYSVLNHPDLNNNPNANIILTTYYNPNSLRNSPNYAVWYNDGDGRWTIFTEDLSDIPLDSAFFVGVGGGAGVSAKHVATAGNISGNYTVIDHPMLNGNPDAIVNFTHNWGTSGTTANVILDKTLGIWYTGSNWSIYTEDQTAMPQDIEFDLFILDPTLDVEQQFINSLSFAPNPVRDVLTVTAADELKNITVFNILGQQVIQQQLEGLSSTVQMSSLPAGNYIARLESESASQVIKLIKL